ncbi:lccl domain containing [Lecanosticta acicola]|uniref:Lccl domain containing n=1 Tax=Lecanosticta acicola TaxID=111012 RepID=A0AAI8YSP9_9PEZI|nr:lccl domain containing [Lecanosticta acicola]
MAPPIPAAYQKPADEESANSSDNNIAGDNGSSHFEPYRDDSDDDETIGPDAPLRRPSVEFDGLSRTATPSWKERLVGRIPIGLRNAGTATVTWVKGPQPPRIYNITPIFPKIQHIPINLLDRYAPARVHRFGLLISLYFVWLLVFSLMLARSSFAAKVPGYGTPVRLSCAARYWGDGNGCGLNGDQCRPFTNVSLAFRCPADCHKIQVLNPHAVGDQEVVYKPLVVGGPTNEQTGFEADLVEDAVYRGDSFICASAVHSGFIKNIEGGCGVLTLTGEQTGFPDSKRNGIESVGFDSYFPRTFGFLKGTRAQCKDLRWPALVPSVVFTVIISLFTTDPGVHFWSIFVGLFFHVALVSDPPANTTYYGLLSIACGRFLPACFCAWVIYQYTVKRSLTGLTAQIEKTMLWLGPAWVGSLNNYTFDRIPIQRLTPHDIQAQPGAVPALIIIVLAIFLIALGQAWAFRIEGRMPRYLVLYGIMVATLLIMLAVPGLDLRIHHYILGLLLVPGTSFQNRPSLVYQGLLVGLFINGIARWGFDSILQTPAELLRGVQQNTLLPAISVLAIGAKNITFNMGPLPVYDAKAKATYDGVSVLVNDVERFRGYGDDRSYWDDNTGSGGTFAWTWKRHTPKPGQSEAEAAEDGDLDVPAGQLPEYFRFAYMDGSRTADYSKAGKWDEGGRWIEMQPGPSL